MSVLSSIHAADGVELAAGGPTAIEALSSALLVALPIVFAAWIGLYLWTGFALSRMFARTGGEPWKAWVPFLNEAEVFARGDKPAYALVYCFIPVVAIYGLVVRIAAVHRINGRFGRGAGSTVLGIVLPPVWMSVLAWGREPVAAAAGRVTAVVEDAVDPATAFAPRDASGYAIPVAAPIEVQPVEAVAQAAPQLRPAPVVQPAPTVQAVPVAAPPVPAAQPAAVQPVAVEPAAAQPAAQPGARAQWRVELADGTAFDLNAPRIVLGRNPEPATPDEQRIALPDQTRTLSKTHARLTYADGAWRLSDLASTNGTRVVDASGTVFELQPGEPTVVAERFRLGEVELRLAYDLVG